MASPEELCARPGGGNRGQRERGLQSWNTAGGATGHWGAIEDSCEGRATVRWASESHDAGCTEGQVTVGRAPGGPKLPWRWSKVAPGGPCLKQGSPRLEVTQGSKGRRLGVAVEETQNLDSRCSRDGKVIAGAGLPEQALMPCSKCRRWAGGAWRPRGQRGKNDRERRVFVVLSSEGRLSLRFTS